MNRSEISPDIDDVSNEEERNKGVDDERRIMTAHIAGETFSGHATYLRADYLDRAHQRVGKQQRPSQGVAELCAGVRKGGHSARIVVRRARDKARPHDIGELRPIRLFDLVRGGANIHLRVFAHFENNTLLNKKRLRMFRFLWNLSIGARVLFR